MNSLVIIIHRLFILTLVAVQPVHAEYMRRKSKLRENRGVKRLTAATVANRMTRPCTLFLRVTQFEDHTDEKQWLCELDPADMNGESGFFVDINIDFTDQNDPTISTFESGVTKLDGNSIYIHGHHAYVHGSPTFQNEKLAMETQNQRRLQVVEGTKTVLVIRGKAADSETSLSTEELALKIFGVGDGEDEFNLSSGYDECSYGKLKFMPTDESATENGVLTVEMNDIFVENSSVPEMQNAMLNKAKEILQISNFQSIADYTMLCIPPGTADLWVAYAYVNGWLSVYNDEWCKYPSAQMHEIGHNLGLGHSNDEEGEYHDQSGMMGFSYAEDDEKPRMCFNNAKNYQLGWFADKEQIVQPLEEEWNGALIGYVDYTNPYLEGNEKIIVTVSGHSLDFHIGFNRAKGLNADNKEGANDKVLIQSRDPQNPSPDSQLVAKLRAGDSYEIDNFANGSRSVIVEVISIDSNGPLQKAMVSVKMDSCATDNDCDDNDVCTIDICDDSTKQCTHTTDEWCSEPLLKVVVRTDNYPAETSWSIVDNCNGDKEILSGTNYDIKNNLYEKSLNVVPSRYSMKVMDTYGDGMCCEYGNGMYLVTYGNDTVAQGGDFGYENTETWGYCDTEAPSQSPVKELKISVSTDRYPGETSWSIIDVCDNNKEVMSDGPYEGKSKLYTTTEIVTPSKFKLIMRDTWGDGMCCQHGQGNYKVHYAGNMVESGGTFESVDVKEFGEEACPSTPSTPSILPSISPSISPSILPSSPPSNMPTFMPTQNRQCGMIYDLTISIGDQVEEGELSWNILYDKDLSIAATNTTIYALNETYVESGCLEKTCYRFNFMNYYGYGTYSGSSYSLKIDDTEIVRSGENGYYFSEETTLFGTCSS